MNVNASFIYKNSTSYPQRTTNKDYYLTNATTEDELTLLNILDGIPKTQVLVRDVIRDRIRKVNIYADLPPYMVSTQILISESVIDYSEIKNKIYKFYH